MTDSTKPKKKIRARHFIETFATSGFVLGCSFLQGVILARLLGPDGRGDYAAIILWPTALANIGLFGTNYVIGRISAKEVELGDLLRGGVVLAGITSVITALLGYLLLPYLIPPDKHHILQLARFFLIYIPVYQIAANLAAIDQGSGNFSRGNFIRAIQSPVLISFLILIILLKLHNLLWFVSAMFLSFSFVTMGRLVLLVKEHSIKGGLYPLTRIVRDSFSFGLVGLAAQAYQYIDRILLLWLLQPQSMGFYVVGLSIGAVLRSITGSMAHVSFTITAQAEVSEGFNRVSSIFRKAAIAMFFCGGVLAVLIPFLLPLVYGSKFKGAVLPSILLIFGSIFAGFCLLLDTCMRGQGKPFAGLIGRVVAIIIMVIIGYPFRIFGATGIAISFVLGQIGYLITMFFQLVGHYKNAKLSDFLPRLSDAVDILNVFKRTVKTIWLRISDLAGVK